MKNNKFVLGFLLGLTFLMLLGAFTRDWTESTPTDSTVANQIDDYNRYLRVDTSDRLENMFYGFIAGENTLSQHCQYLQFYEQASITQPSAGYGRLGCKAVGGKCELFWHDEDDDEIQLTSGGGFGGCHINLTAGMDLLGSSTSDITINTNKFTVAGATGNTVIAGTLSAGVSTLADTSALATSGAPAADAQIANKKYVDDHVGHDGDGYVLLDVDGTPTKVYTKYLTGTLDADSETTVAHGVTTGKAKILSLSATAYNDDLAKYVSNEFWRAENIPNYFYVAYNDTNVIFTGVGTYVQGNAYRIQIDYIL